MKELKVIVGVSNRHIHLSAEHRDLLFGLEHPMHFQKPLYQPGQYMAEETVSLIGPNGRIDKVHVVCPLRGQTQVELSKTDTFRLGVPVHFRQSGDLAGSSGLVVEGPGGSRVELQEGAIVVLRHLHIDSQTAGEHGICDGQIVSVDIKGVRAITMHNVLARVSEQFVPEYHVDMDEANACDIRTGDYVSVLKCHSSLHLSKHAKR